MWRNTESGYGIVAVVLHWSTAVTVIGLFALGLWMVDLSYYDPWYRRAPEIHKGVGVLLFGALLFRVLWRRLNPRPRPGRTLTAFERRASSAAHALLYLLLLTIMVSGYLISTADGRPIDVFGLFQVPATLSRLPNQADVAGDVHFVLAVSMVSLASVHAAAALKHHFLDRDHTLLRMLGIGKPAPPTTKERIGT
jgi:cytochrome b561